MKVSVITASLNCGPALASCLQSVRDQTHPDIEHWVIDACSTDNTPEVVREYGSRLAGYVREKDGGMYEGINKGIGCATGDVIAVLNGDDAYADPSVLADVVKAFEVTGADCVYGDVAYVRRTDLQRTVRYWKSGIGGKRQMLRGWMPPHPAFFVKRQLYSDYGGYDVRYRIAADYELMLRLLYREGISTHYLDRLCVRMRLGGASNRNIGAMAQKSLEDLRICRAAGIPHPMWTVFLKNVQKLPQFVFKHEK